MCPLGHESEDPPSTSSVIFRHMRSLSVSPSLKWDYKWGSSQGAGWDLAAFWDISWGVRKETTVGFEVRSRERHESGVSGGGAGVAGGSSDWVYCPL